MSLSQINPAIKTIISSEEPHAFVIKGRWGVGKTYLWKMLVKEAATKKEFGKEAYAYVSLFGLSDLNDLRTAIFASLQTVDDTGDQQELKPREKLNRYLKKHGAKLFRFRDLISKDANLSGIANFLAYQAVSDAVLCIDDVERRSDGIKIRDLVGIVSQLREERGCTVCLILNENSLEKAELDEFRTHGEKVFDSEFQFEPTTIEAIDIVVPQDQPYREVIHECVLRLHITNFRIIHRILTKLDQLSEALPNRSNEVVESVIRATVFLTWAFYYKESDGIPFEEARLAGSDLAAMLLERDGISEEQKHWNAIRTAYGYRINNDIDQKIADSIQRGYFVLADLTKDLDARDADAANASNRLKLFEAWDIYSDSFNDNENDFIDALINAVKSHPEVLSLTNLSKAAEILRQLDRDNEADDIVDHFLEHQQHIRKITSADLQNNMRYNEVTDPYILKRFSEVAEQVRDTRTLNTVFQRLTTSNGYGPDDFDFLAKCSVEEYISFFNEIEGDFLSNSIMWGLRIGTLSNPTEKQETFVKKVKEALIEIAGEHRFNAIRVQNIYGISISE